jgi:hypothetical protein
MKRILHNTFPFTILTLTLLTFSSINLKADPGDTTWIMTYNQEYHNWVEVHRDTFQLPSTNISY